MDDGLSDSEGSLGGKKADSQIRTLQLLLRERGEQYLGAADSFSFLAEMLLLYRRYPDGPPSLDWNDQLRFLIRIEEPASRMLYARETGYRGWASVNVSQAIHSQLFAKFQQPALLWRYRLSDEALQVVSAPAAFYLIQTVTSQTLSSGERVHQAEAIELDLSIGSPRLLGKLSCRQSCEAALWGSQALYVSSSEGLLRLQAGSAQLVVPSKNADCVCAPLPSPEGLVTDGAQIPASTATRVDPPPRVERGCCYKLGCGTCEHGVYCSPCQGPLRCMYKLAACMADNAWVCRCHSPLAIFWARGRVKPPAGQPGKL